MRSRYCASLILIDNTRSPSREIERLDTLLNNMQMFFSCLANTTHQQHLRNFQFDRRKKKKFFLVMLKCSSFFLDEVEHLFLCFKNHLDFIFCIIFVRILYPFFLLDLQLLPFVLFVLFLLFFNTYVAFFFLFFYK